ncbi:MAG: hypothetical protein R3C11_12960 [Planctomycetaceae bacterium]
MSDYDDLIINDLVSYQSQLDSGVEAEPTHLDLQNALPVETKQLLVENRQCLDFIDKIRRLMALPEQAPLPKFIGRFQVLSQIGTGGYGIVFRALDTNTNREVAIKIPRPEIMMSTEHVQRFRNEARTSAQLDHQIFYQFMKATTKGSLRIS